MPVERVRPQFGDAPLEVKLGDLLFTSPTRIPLNKVNRDVEVEVNLKDAKAKIAPLSGHRVLGIYNGAPDPLVEIEFTRDQWIKLQYDYDQIGAITLPEGTILELQSKKRSKFSNDFTLKNIIPPPPQPRVLAEQEPLFPSE